MTTVSAPVGERPILMRDAMVHATIEGLKTQTRRRLAPQPVVRASGALEWIGGGRTFTWFEGASMPDLAAASPYGRPGDWLWVRETFLHIPTEQWSAMYADDEDYDICVPTKGQKMDLGWRVVPSIHMPRWASRLTLEITEVRVERLQAITSSDCEAEGLTKRGYWWDVGAHWEGDGMADDPVEAYRALWDSLNAKTGYSWKANPWVWVISFRRIN